MTGKHPLDGSAALQMYRKLKQKMCHLNHS